MTGWLEKSVGLPCIEGRGKSVVLATNGTLKTALASSKKALGVRVVSHDQNEDAPSQVPQEVWRDHEQDCQGGSHAERGARYAMHGHAANKSKSLSDYDWAVLELGRSPGAVSFPALRDCPGSQGPTPVD